MEGIGSVGSEDGTISSVTGSARISEDGEFNVAVSELERLGSSDFVFRLNN